MARALLGLSTLRPAPADAFEAVPSQQVKPFDAGHGMQKRGGFTLIEIMIVVVIIAILAAIGVVKYSAVKQQAYLATVKHDLKNLAISEEAFASSNGGVYFSHTYTDPADSANTFGASQGVLIVVTAAGQAGWSATATHANVPGHNCSVFVGLASVPPATADGAPACN